MRLFLVEHQHQPAECAIAVAAWKGLDSPLRGGSVISSCANGGHRAWFVIHAESETAALDQLPRYLADRAVTHAVEEMRVP
jgi:hypothetical protein